MHGWLAQVRHRNVAAQWGIGPASSSTRHTSMASASIHDAALASLPGTLVHMRCVVVEDSHRCAHSPMMMQDTNFCALSWRCNAVSC